MQFRGARGWILSAAFAVISLSLMGQVAPPTAPNPRPSPAGVVYATIEGTYPNGKGFLIYYSRPSVTLNGNTRKIWGSLVPWGQPWRLGANEATLMVTPLPLDIGGTTVPAGTYTLYMLPVENGDSKLIINKSLGQLGNTYDEKQDLARITMKRETLSSNVDQLLIAATQAGDTTTLKVAWEGLQFSVPVKVKK